MATFSNWNPSDKAAGITLSNGNLTATSGSTYSAVRAALGLSAGKYYWEITAGAQATTAVGIAKSTASLTAAVGSDANAWVYNASDGSIYNNNAAIITVAAYAAGDKLMFAVDLAAGKMWVGKNGTWQNSGNPAAGTGAVVTGLSGTFYPFFVGSNGSADTANFGASAFNYTVPSGFGAGWYTNTSTVFTASAGSYALTGAAVLLGKLLRMTASAGSYALTGTAITIIKALKLTATAGAYVLTGKAATLGKGLHMTAAAGAYALTGAATTLKRGYFFTASAGTYVLTGIALVQTVVAASPFIRKTKFFLQKLRAAPPTLDQ